MRTALTTISGRTQEWTDRLSRSIISRDKRAPLSSHLFVLVVVVAVLFVELVLAISRYVCVFTFLENIMQMSRLRDRSVDPNPKAIKLRECCEIGLVADRRNALKIMLKSCGSCRYS